MSPIAALSAVCADPAVDPATRGAAAAQLVRALAYASDRTLAAEIGRAEAGGVDHVAGSSTDSRRHDGDEGANSPRLA